MKGRDCPSRATWLPVYEEPIGVLLTTDNEPNLGSPRLRKKIGLDNDFSSAGYYRVRPLAGEAARLGAFSP